MPNVVARRRPQLPGRDAASVPARIAVGTLVAPQIAMPSEPEHRLAAHTAIAWPLGMGLGIFARLAARVSPNLRGHSRGSAGRILVPLVFAIDCNNPISGVGERRPAQALLEKQQQDIYRAAFQRSGRAWKAIAGTSIRPF